MAQYDFVFGTEVKTPAQPKAFAPYNLIVYIALTTLLVVTSFLVGVMYERRTNTANAAELATFWQVWDIVEQDYYGDLPPIEMRKYGAIQGMLNTLNDPFTSFAPPDLAAARREQLDGHFGGVGIVIEQTEDFHVRVKSVIPGNPADQAGIQAGDIFLEVDGTPVANYSTERISEVVRGEVGSQVELTMLRPSTGETYTVMVTRAIIETPTVFSENRDGIGYVQLSTFSGVATTQMREHLTALFDQGVRAIVLDLRANGGGLLSQSVDVADLFLDEGIILTQRSADGSEDVFRSDDGDLAEDIPLVVLVDSGTASASEVVAGALQDRERAVLIGQQTFGKGVVQLVYNLADGSQLRVTSSAWFTPDDQPIHQHGLAPDIPVMQFYDSEGNDLVFQAAVDYLNEKYPPDDEAGDE